MESLNIINTIVLIFVIALMAAGLYYIITKTATVFGWILFMASVVTMLIAAMANSALEA